MGKLLGELFKIILQTAFDRLKAWWEQEKRVEAEWLAKSKSGQLESLKGTLAMEAKLKDAVIGAAVTSAIVTPDAWNSGRSASGGRTALGPMVLFAILVLLPGCLVRTVYIDSRMPILPRPSRPVVSTDPWLPREAALVGYAMQLEVVIDGYNVEAKQRNRANGYE